MIRNYKEEEEEGSKSSGKEGGKGKVDEVGRERGKGNEGVFTVWRKGEGEERGVVIGPLVA